MRKEVLSFVAIGVVGLVLMVALGLGFRYFIGRQAATARGAGPESGDARVTIPDSDSVVRPDPPERCLVKARSKWTDAETAAYPILAAWLDAKARRILPWEWSDEAVAKDPVGYCAAWAELCREEQRKLLGLRAGGFVAGAFRKNADTEGDEIAATMSAMADLCRYYDMAGELASADNDARQTTSGLRAAESEALKTLLRAIERR